MLYGVRMFLNDVNFSLKTPSKRVIIRLSYPTVFFTTKEAATIYYNARLSEFEGRKGIIYKNYEQRGKCELFEALVSNGKIEEFGNTLMHDSI